MSITPIPGIPSAPQVAEVKSVVDLIREAKSAYGLFSAITHKKACVAITFAVFFYVFGALVATKVDVWASLWFFGLGTVLLVVYIVSQAWVDVAQMDAIARGATIEATVKAEDD